MNNRFIESSCWWERTNTSFITTFRVEYANGIPAQVVIRLRKTKDGTV